MGGQLTLQISNKHNEVVIMAEEEVNKEKVEKEIKELEDKKADLDKQIEEKKKSIEGK